MSLKWCKSQVVVCPLPTNSYIFFASSTDQKDVGVGVNLAFRPSLLNYFNPLGSPMQPKRCKSFELHFPQKTTYCSLYSYIIVQFMAAPLYHLYTPSKQVTLLFLHHFNPVAAPLLQLSWILNFWTFLWTCRSDPPNTEILKPKLICLAVLSSDYWFCDFDVTSFHKFFWIFFS